uniref:Uncharacterized protein n=1 Tax=Nelumbo nucifera TaxID=4432 RepID=A0A822Y7N6_NELNU|nr:TPA_asm: hypothetical protein HUJ06_028797 [Nelumbo nucifera]
MMMTNDEVVLLFNNMVGNGFLDMLLVSWYGFGFPTTTKLFYPGFKAISAFMPLMVNL